MMSIQLGIFFSVITIFAWGTSDFIGAYVSRKTSSLKAFTLLRFFGLIALIILIPFFLQSVTFTLPIIILVLLLGSLNAIAGSAFYKGLTVGEVSVVSPLAASYPALTVILSIFFLGEALTNLQIIAIVGTIFGALLISFKFKDIFKLDPKRAVRGVKYAIIAALAWAFQVFLIGVLAKNLGWFLPILFMYMIALFYLFSYARLYKRDISFPIRRLLILIALSAFLDVVALLSYSISTTVAYISIVATASSVYPVVTILLARFFFKERLDINQWIGVISVLTGLVLLSIQ